MTTKTNHGAVIEMQDASEFNLPIEGFRWQEKDREHKIGLADPKDGTIIIVAEIKDQRKYIRLLNRTAKTLMKLLLKHYEL